MQYQQPRQPPPTVDAATGEVEVDNPTATEVITPAASATFATSAESDSDSSGLYSASSSSCASEENFEQYQLEYEKEDEDLFFFKNLCTEVTDDGLETMVFSVTDLDALKEKEKNLRAKEDSKYFRCKKADSKLYKQLCEAIAPYLTDEKLRMLNHPWSTQLNEAMNNSISSYAPKTKTFCRTMSLLTRVGIAAAIQALGYLKFWTLVFRELGIDMDDAFASSLKARDRKKAAKRVTQKSKKGKLVRRKDDFAKYTQSHVEQMDDAKTGKTYGAGVALATAKKQAKEKLTAAIRNPKGTPKHLQRCAYYPHHCLVLGHTTAGNKSCGVNDKSPDERKKLLSNIKERTIDEELVCLQVDRKYICSLFSNLTYVNHQLQVLLRSNFILRYT